MHPATQQDRPNGKRQYRPKCIVDWIWVEGSKGVHQWELVMHFVPFVEETVAEDVQQEEQVRLNQQAEQHVRDYLRVWGDCWVQTDFGERLQQEREKWVYD